MIPASEWKRNVGQKSVSKFTTVSDEAFALLLLENVWDGWAARDLDEYLKEREYDEVQQKEKRRKPVYGKYTPGKRGELRYGGWTNEGIDRFNELYKLVQADRNGDHAKSVEKQYLKKCRGKLGAKHSKGDEVDESPLQRRSVAMHDELVLLEDQQDSDETGEEEEDEDDATTGGSTSAEDEDAEADEANEERGGEGSNNGDGAGTDTEEPVNQEVTPV